MTARSDSFNETGGFGALAANVADSNSFATTLGVRVTSKMSVGAYGFVVPELRIGWNHEFLDASQTISGSLLGVPGSAFSTTGINFGRDSALVGAGVSADHQSEREGLPRLRRQAQRKAPGALGLGRHADAVLIERGLCRVRRSPSCRRGKRHHLLGEMARRAAPALDLAKRRSFGMAALARLRATIGIGAARSSCAF